MSNDFLKIASSDEATNGHVNGESSGPVQADPRDTHLLDAYSQAVMHVVETVAPAVISVGGRDHERQLGSGSGFIITPDGYVITNSHVINGRSKLGFAIPSNTVQWVATEMLMHGRVRRRMLGISATVRRLPRAMVRQLDLLSDQVVEVMDVAADGAAGKAGLRPGDLIVSMNDRMVSTIDDIHRLLSRQASLDGLELTVVRDEHKFQLSVGWPALRR